MQMPEAEQPNAIFFWMQQYFFAWGDKFRIFNFRYVPFFCPESRVLFLSTHEHWTVDNLEL